MLLCTSNRSRLTSIKKIGHHSWMVDFHFSLRFDVSLTDRLPEDVLASSIWLMLLSNILSPVCYWGGKKINHCSQFVFQKLQVLLAEVCIKPLSFPGCYSTSFIKGNMTLFKCSWAGFYKAVIDENSFSVIISKYLLESFRLYLYRPCKYFVLGFWFFFKLTNEKSWHLKKIITPKNQF